MSSEWLNKDNCLDIFGWLGTLSYIGYFRISDEIVRSVGEQLDQEEQKKQ